MGGASKNIFRGLKYLVVLLLVVAVSMPTVTLSQEETATTMPESVPSMDDAAIATTTSPTATTTNELLPPVFEPEAATSTEEVLGASIADAPEENVEEDIEEEEDFFDQTAAAILSVPTPQSLALSVREFRKRVVPDGHAFHSCEAEVFRIDISGKARAMAGIRLQRDSDASYEIEIGGLPQGIDVTFSKNGLYQYVQGANDRSLELAIINQPGSQKGNFGVPIIYTRKGVKDSSVICQINIINL